MRPRVRFPDILAVRAGESVEQYLTRPPLIAIEILSPEDTLRAVQEKAAQYFSFGVRSIWIIDPERRKAYQYTSAGLEEVETGELTVPETPNPGCAERMFAKLDQE